MPKGKQSWKHRANKNRDSEIDIPDKFKVMKIIKKHFGIITLTDQTVIIPDGGYASYRKPDLFWVPRRTAFELNGEGAHGWGDDISLTERDERKYHDYKLAHIDCYILNSATTENYSEKLVVKSLTEQGLTPLQG